MAGKVRRDDREATRQPRREVAPRVRGRARAVHRSKVGPCRAPARASAARPPTHETARFAVRPVAAVLVPVRARRLIGAPTSGNWARTAPESVVASANSSGG